MNASEKILSGHSSANFITAVDLQLRQVTPKDIEELKNKIKKD